MSDRTATTVNVYEVPEERREAVLAMLEGHGFEDPSDAIPGAWRDYEMRCGTVTDEIVPALLAAGATFEAWEDPAYEWLGSYRAKAPGLPLFSADCDASGRPVFTREAIAAMIAADDVTRGTGDDVEAIIAPLREALNDA